MRTVVVCIDCVTLPSIVHMPCKFAIRYYRLYSISGLLAHVLRLLAAQSRLYYTVR